MDYFWQHHKGVLLDSSSSTLLEWMLLLMPDQDLSRKYGIRETLLVKELVHLFGLERTGRGEKLRQWKGNTHGDSLAGQGNLGSVVGDIVAVIVRILLVFLRQSLSLQSSLPRAFPLTLL